MISQFKIPNFKADAYSNATLQSSIILDCNHTFRLNRMCS